MKKLLRDTRGAAAAEYALLLGLIAVVAVAGMEFIGDSLQGQLATVGQCINTPSSDNCA